MKLIKYPWNEIYISNYRISRECYSIWHFRYHVIYKYIDMTQIYYSHSFISPQEVFVATFWCVCVQVDHIKYSNCLMILRRSFIVGPFIFWDRSHVSVVVIQKTSLGMSIWIYMMMSIIWPINAKTCKHLYWWLTTSVINIRPKWKIYTILGNWY